MEDKVKSLEEVSKEINETLGEFKQFSSQNKYYMVGYRGKGINLENQKINTDLNFPGTNQPISFGHFKSKQGYNSKYKNNKEHANHYGEYLAYIILKQLGKKACKVDLGTMIMKHPYTQKDILVEGCLSHFQLTPQEIFKPISVSVVDFKNAHPKKYRELTERGRTNSERNYTNVEIILETINDLLEKSGQKEKIPEIRKKFFDMCMFDIKFANRDRHDENFGLRINQDTDEIDFYHLFDNEQILGFQEDKANIQKYLSNSKEYQKFKDRELTSCIGIPFKTQKIKHTELLTYLLENYYDETMDSLKDIGRYKLENLEELMNICPGLSDEHKELAKKIFIEREKEINETVQKFEKERMNRTYEDDSDQLSV